MSDAGKQGFAEDHGIISKVADKGHIKTWITIRPKCVKIYQIGINLEKKHGGFKTTFAVEGVHKELSVLGLNPHMAMIEYMSALMEREKNLWIIGRLKGTVESS